MANFSTFLGKGKIISRMLKLCAEAKAAGEFEALRGYAEEGLKAIPEAKAEKYIEQRREFLLFLAEATNHLDERAVAFDALDQAIRLSGENRDFVPVLLDIADDAGTDIIPLLKLGISTARQDIKLLKSLARIYGESGQADAESDKLYRMILSKDPEYGPALIGLAKTSLGLKKFDRETLTPLRLAFRMAPDDKDVLLALALTYSNLDQPPEESRGVLRKALILFPNEKNLFDGLTRIFIKTPGYDDEKVAHLKRAFEHSGDKATAEVLLPYFLKSRMTDDTALKVYEMSWRGHEQKATMLSYLSDFYRAAGRDDEGAVKVYEELFSIYPHVSSNTTYLANIYARDGVSDRTAEIAYERAFRDNPGGTSPQAVKLLSRCYLSVGREDDLARTVYQKQLGYEEDDLSVMIALGEMAMGKEHLSGEDVKLLKTLFYHGGVQKKLKQDISSRLGEHLSISGAGDKVAIEVYEYNYSSGRATEAEENHLASFYARKKVTEPRLRRLFESVYSRTGDADVLSALTGIYVELKEVDDQAIDIFLAHLAKHPTDKKVLGLVCPFLLKKRAEDESTYPFIVEALKRDPKLEFIGMKTGEVNNELTRIGRHLLKYRNFPLALELFKAAYPRVEDSITQYLLGVSYLANGDVGTAESIFLDLQKKDRDNPIFLYRLASVDMALGRTDQARKSLEVLRAKYNGHPLPLLRLGMLAELEGKNEEALEQYSRVNSPSKELKALAMARRGIVLLRLGRFDDAINAMEQSRQEIGGNGEILKGLAASYATRVLNSIDINDLGTASRTVTSMLGLGLRDVPLIELTGRLAYLVNLKQLISGNAGAALEGVASVLNAIDAQQGSLFLGALIEHFNRRYAQAEIYIDSALDMGRRLGEFEPDVELLAALNLVRLRRFFEANDRLEWLYSHQHRVEDAFILRIISFYQNQDEKGYPSFLKGQDYHALRDRLKLSLGFVGSLFLKGSEFVTGISFFERVYKELIKSQDKLEADFFLGLFHIKSRKQNVGLHYWRDILDIKDTGDLLPDILNQIYFSLFVHFLDNYYVTEAQEALSRIKPDGQVDLDGATLFLYLQKGYNEAKGGNVEAACREWERALSIHPSNWRLNQNLALAKTILNKEEEAASHFNVLIHELERGGEKEFGPAFTFIFEESRKVYNHLVSFRTGAIQQIEAKRDIIQDNIVSANKAYWSLNLRKGDTFKEAERNYFRLIKIYNPERYPDEFKEIEAAYAFFKREGHLKKNEQLVFNSFDLQRYLEGQDKVVASEIPTFPSVKRFINEFTNPKRFFDLGEITKDAREAVAKIKPEIPGAEYTVDDWLMDW